jgi:chaperonin cofactor prefoldin
MIETIAIFVGKAAASAVFDAIKKSVLGIEFQEVSIEDWGKTAVLAIFAMQSMRPELSFEKKAEIRMNDLQNQINEVKKDIDDLKKDMSAFQWKVDSLFYEAREENLWQEMLNLDNSIDSYYTQMATLTRSRASDEDKRWRASELANNIISGLQPQIANTRARLLGEDVGAGKERVRGFLEIWREQALRDADMGWDGDRLAKIYDLLESKFTRALLIQLKCVRLLMEAYETQHAEGASEQDALDYYSQVFFPILKREVEGFRDLVESLAVNLIPLPTGTMLPLGVPPEIMGMLAGLDLFTGQALGGKLTGAKDQMSGRLPRDVPATTGCWGRVIVPGTRWIRRAPGSKEEALTTVTTPASQKFTSMGTLEVRAVKFTPYEGKDGRKLHQGYQIQVGNEPRDMNAMLVAHFTPSDVLPEDFAVLRNWGGLSLELKDMSGDVLAQTKAFVMPVNVGERGITPYGTFTMSFTGGAALRGK